MGSLCTPSGVHCRLSRWFLGKCFLLVASASLHDWFLHFLESAFSVTCFGAFFWRWHERVWSVDVIMSGVGQ